MLACVLLTLCSFLMPPDSCFRHFIFVEGASCDNSFRVGLMATVANPQFSSF